MSSNRNVVALRPVSDFVRRRNSDYVHRGFELMLEGGFIADDWSGDVVDQVNSVYAAATKLNVVGRHFSDSVRWSECDNVYDYLVILKDLNGDQMEAEVKSPLYMQMGPVIKKALMQGGDRITNIALTERLAKEGILVSAMREEGRLQIKLPAGLLVWKLK